jgi:hypothetical protein
VFKFYFQNFLDICSGANVKKHAFFVSDAAAKLAGVFVPGKACLIFMSHGEAGLLNI